MYTCVYARTSFTGRASTTRNKYNHTPFTVRLFLSAALPRLDTNRLGDTTIDCLTILIPISKLVASGQPTVCGSRTSHAPSSLIDQFGDKTYESHTNGNDERVRHHYLSQVFWVDD